MTTIAYKDGVIAYDSRVSADTLIISDTANKRVHVNGVDFFFVGAVHGQERLLKSYFLKDYTPSKSPNCAAMVVDEGELFIVQVNKEKGMFRTPLDPSIPHAMGSGEDHALTAMDMGASAAEAVKMAAKRDMCTGGKVRTFKCKLER